MSAKNFHDHLDACSQCEQNPMGLCSIGDQLLKACAKTIHEGPIPPFPGEKFQQGKAAHIVHEAIRELRRFVPEEDAECPECHSGTIGYEEGEARCRGECGSTWKLKLVRKMAFEPPHAVIHDEIMVTLPAGEQVDLSKLRLPPIEVGMGVANLQGIAKLELFADAPLGKGWRDPLLDAAVEPFKSQFNDPKEFAEGLKEQGILPPEATEAWVESSSLGLESSGAVVVEGVVLYTNAQRPCKSCGAPVTTAVPGPAPTCLECQDKENL